MGGSEKFLTYAHLEFEAKLDPGYPGKSERYYVCGMKSDGTADDAKIIENVTTMEECYNIANASNELGLWHVNSANQGRYKIDNNSADSTTAPFSSEKGGYFGYSGNDRWSETYQTCYVYNKDHMKGNCLGDDNDVKYAGWPIIGETYEAKPPEFDASFQGRFFKSKKIPMLQSTLKKAGINGGAEAAGVAAQGRVEGRREGRRLAIRRRALRPASCGAALARRLLERQCSVYK